MKDVRRRSPPLDAGAGLSYGESSDLHTHYYSQYEIKILFTILIHFPALIVNVSLVRG